MSEHDLADAALSLLLDVGSRMKGAGDGRLTPAERDTLNEIVEAAKGEVDDED